MLDTPLLTYREPLGSRHGELSVDEVELKRTGLATHFYNHLASLEGLGQFVVIENADPPTDLDKTLPVQTFTANPDSGRYGFFPLKRTG